MTGIMQLSCIPGFKPQNLSLFPVLFLLLLQWIKRHEVLKLGGLRWKHLLLLWSLNVTPTWKPEKPFLCSLCFCPFSIPLSYFPAPFSGSNPAGAFSACKISSPQEQIQEASRELGKWVYTGTEMALQELAPIKSHTPRVPCLIRRREKSLADTANACKQTVRTNLAWFDRVGSKIRGLWSYKVVLQPCEDLTGLQLPQAGIWGAPDVLFVLSLKTGFGNLVGVLKRNSPVLLYI